MHGAAAPRDTTRCFIAAAAHPHGPLLRGTARFIVKFDRYCQLQPPRRLPSARRGPRYRQRREQAPPGCASRILNAFYVQRRHSTLHKSVPLKIWLRSFPSLPSSFSTLCENERRNERMNGRNDPPSPPVNTLRHGTIKHFISFRVSHEEVE